jgi:hypothetical protein
VQHLLEDHQVKKDTKAWAIKLRGRSFYLSTTGSPWTFTTKKEAESFAQNVARHYGTTAQPIRVRVRIEEIV